MTGCCSRRDAANMLRSCVATSEEDSLLMANVCNRGCRLISAKRGSPRTLEACFPASSRTLRFGNPIVHSTKPIGSSSTPTLRRTSSMDSKFSNAFVASCRAAPRFGAEISGPMERYTWHWPPAGVFSCQNVELGLRDIFPVPVAADGESDCRRLKE